jgi:hypothetical protein
MDPRFSILLLENPGLLSITVEAGDYSFRVSGFLLMDCAEGPKSIVGHEL